MADHEPWDEVIGPARNAKTELVNSDDEPTMSATASSSSSGSRMPSRWSQYEKDTDQLRHESHEANCKAVELASEKIANSPPHLSAASSIPIRGTISSASSYDSEDGSGEYGMESDAAIRAEALKMLELADDHLSTPYNVRKTQSGGFSASYSGGFGKHRSSIGDSQKHVPKALAGIDFSKRSSFRASHTPSALSSFSDKSHGVEYPYAERDHLVNFTGTSTSEKKEGKWSSRYSIDHTLLALSGGRSRSSNAKDVLDQLERETDREIKSARNLFVTSPTETPSIFGAGGFTFRDHSVFGNKTKKSSEQATLIDSSINLKTAWIESVSGGLEANGKSLDPPEPRKTWQEQVERKKRMQRRLVLVSLALCATIAILIGVVVSRKGGKDTQASASESTSPNRGTPEVVFYVTSDSPFDSSEEQKLSADLGVLPDAEFLVHLGNIQDSSVSLCSEARYSRVRDVLMQSPVPMFILPGEEDWNNCPKPDTAWQAWQDNFSEFEENFEHNFVVSRQMRRKENFSFLYHGVLFIGFHLVGGRIDNQDEWDSRLNDDINWMESMVTMNQGNFNHIVMFGNARPGPHQKVFFERLSVFLGPLEMPIIYVHANSGVGGVLKYNLFGGDEGIEALQSEDGGQNPPLRISIYAGDTPFVVG